MFLWKAFLSVLYFTRLVRGIPMDDPTGDTIGDPIADPISEPTGDPIAEPADDDLFGEPTGEPTGGVDSVKSKPDLFYHPPVGFEKTAPGTILRYRRVPRPISLTNVTPVRPKGAWQIQYRTQNSIGEPEANIMTVLEPWNAKPGHVFVEGFFVVSIKPINSIHQ
jgi:hypothetical protein